MYLTFSLLSVRRIWQLKPSCLSSTEQPAAAAVEHKAGSTGAPGPGVTHFVTEEKCPLGHILGLRRRSCRPQEEEAAENLPISCKRRLRRWKEDTAQRLISASPFRRETSGNWRVAVHFPPHLFLPLSNWPLLPPSMVWTMGVEDTSLDQGRGDGEQLSPKVSPNHAGVRCYDFCCY